MRISLYLSKYGNNHNITLIPHWDWKGRDHGKPYEQPGEHLVSFYYGFIIYTRYSDVIDQIKYYESLDKLPKLLNWHGVNNKSDLLDKNQFYLPKRKYKKYKKIWSKKQ